MHDRAFIKEKEFLRDQKGQEKEKLCDKKAK